MAQNYAGYSGCNVIGNLLQSQLIITIGPVLDTQTRQLRNFWGGLS